MEHSRTGLSREALKQGFLDHLFYTQGRFPEVATRNDLYMSLAYTVRDRLLDRWITTMESCLQDPDLRVVSYLSAEFLTGPHLGINLINLGIYDHVRDALAELGIDLDVLLAHEQEPGLGNGGLGRLAACYMDSLATLERPAIGYGIRYEFGIFDQAIRDGWQVELTDEWLHLGNPWEIHRPEITHEVKYGGHTENFIDSHGEYRVNWIPGKVVKGVAYDTPILGYRVNACNTLRLWRAEAVESFDFHEFNVGDYYGAVEEKITSETISKVLYPNDEPAVGKRLRLAQQYFFVSCSLQDMLRMHCAFPAPPEKFHEGWAVQLNDTHPAIGVAELMRLLVDEHLMDWDDAWNVTQRTFGYTNHTLLPEALEKWPLPLFGELLPRHLEIIYEINHRFLQQVRIQNQWSSDRIARVSIIDESGERYIRMAHLACVGSHAINGVAALHSDLLKQDVLKDFYDLFPEKFSNKTNGVSQRRFVALSNPRLTRLITDAIGDGWIKDLDGLRALEPFVDDSHFREEWRRVKRENKADLATRVADRTGVSIDPDSMFDVQVKRFHEYKRQHLNLLHIVTLYTRLKKDPKLDIAPRTFLFGGKAAPGYFMAKLIIKLINSVAEVINADPEIAGRLRVVFYPDFNVKNAQRVYPAADLSEQISTAGKEASGTGNMKFALNGALTIGTLDGANIEIREEVGAENFFLFGLTAEQVYEMKAQGYAPRAYYESDATLREVLDLIGSGFFAHGDASLFKPLVDELLYDDQYMLLADHRAYVNCQETVGGTYVDQDRWTRMSILNVARAGKFSSDRAVREYCDEIWRVPAVPIDVTRSPASLFERR